MSEKVNLNKIVFCKDFGFEDEEGNDEDVVNLTTVLNDNDIFFKDIEVIEPAPDFTKKCDLIVLDWGGMGCFGNNLFASFIRQLLEEAEKRPSQLFLIFSFMTEWALSDLNKTIDELPNNVFTSVNKLRKFLFEERKDNE